MKKSYLLLLIFVVFFFSTQAIFVVTAFSADPVSTPCAITFTLKAGSTGEQVKCLQAAVGASPDGHFGPLTKSAVMVWQLNHGLSPDGVVGPITRAALISVKVTKVTTDTYPDGCTSTDGYSITTGVKCDSKLRPLTSNNSQKNNTNTNNGETNPNLKNLDAYIAAVKRGALKGGLSEDKLSILEEKIRKQAETGPDLRQEFLNIVNNKISKNISDGPILAFLKEVISLVDDIFSIKKALAVSGLPFGGTIEYADTKICDCSIFAVTELFVSSPTISYPLSNLLLDYLNGSEMYLNHNMPEEGIQVLGLYEPSDDESCYTYVGEDCIPIVSDGLISPIVGSSPTP